MIKAAAKKTKTRSHRRTVCLSKHISSRSDVRLGQPCFNNTRIPVATVLEYLADMGSIQKVCKEWEGELTPEAIAEALRLCSDLLRSSNMQRSIQSCIQHNANHSRR